MIQRPFNRSGLAVALVAIGFALGAQAQNAPSGDKTNPAGAAARQSAMQGGASHTNVPADDRQFAQKAAEAGMGEVHAAKIAEQKSQDAQVKQFAQRMVGDHGKANDKLKQIASSKGLDLPTHLDKSAQQEIDKLEKVSGDQFDETYMKKQVSDHHKAIDLFQKEAKSGKDGDLRDFAQSTLPTLQEHLKLAKAAEKGVMSKSASSNSSKSSKSSVSSSGMKAAKKATGSTYVTAEKQEGMPVPKTGM